MLDQRIGDDARGNMRALDRYSPEILSSPLTYTHPSDVLQDPNLTLDEQRKILAWWLSDANAVESMPHLRRNARGDVVPIDAIMDALRVLDLQVGPPSVATARRQTLSEDCQSRRRITPG